MLEVDNVTKSYPGEPPVQALRGVNLTIGQGELVGIVGPSGSGKTTLLQLMGTLDRPTSGRVRITGLDVATMADDDVAYLRATRIGFIFQQFFLAEHSTVLDNVADGLLYAGIPLKQRRQRALDALDLVGLAQRPHARPTQLSGGQRQRVAIARALVGQPAIVLADEPTGNLDQATGQSILALIDQLHQAGSTIVVITHDHAIAERMPRKVEILDGHIVADTGPAAGTDPRLRPLAQPPTHAPQTASGAPVERGAVMTATATLTRRRLPLSDLTRLSTVGLRTRKLRAGLSALGIAIGVAAIVAVLGLSSSSQAGLLNEINQLGTNLLTVSNGQSFTGAPAELPTTAPAMIGRISGVQQVQTTGTVSGANAYRNPYIPSDRHQRPDRPSRIPRPPPGGRHQRRPGPLPQRGHRPRTRRRARRRRRAAPRDRPHLPRRTHLGRRPMVLRGRHPQTGRAGLCHRLLRPGRLPRGREVPGLRRPSLHHLPPRPERPGQRRRQPSRRHRQPREPQRGQRQPTLLRPGRPSRRQERPQRPVPRPRRRRPPGRRGRRRQHHDHLRPRTPLRDRPAPRPRRHQRPHPHPVPLRSRPSRTPWRRRRRCARRRVHRRLRPHQRLGHRRATEAWLGGFAASLIIGAVAGLMPALRAARLSPTQALWSV